MKSLTACRRQPATAKATSAALEFREASRRGSITARQLCLVALCLSLLLPRSGWAQEVGTIAELTGMAEVGRSGTWTALSVGAPVHEGDTLRTGQPGGLRVVFQDDSVLTVGGSSELVIDAQVFKPAQGRVRSLVRLLHGKLRSLVSDYYRESGAAYSIETETAVSGVRGTEFVVIVDPDSQATDVVGVTGRVEVHSVFDRVERGVILTTWEVTTVKHGQFPTPPRRLSDEVFRQYLDGLEFIGQGQAESLVMAHPLLASSVPPEPDRATLLTTMVPPPPEPDIESKRVIPRDASTLLEQPLPVVEAIQGRVGIHF